MNYSHTENLIIVTGQDAQNRPNAWAIVGTIDYNQRGNRVGQRIYKQRIPCHRDGTRIV